MRQRRRSGCLVGLVALVVLLVVGYIVADVALRSYAQDRVRQQIVDSLPPGVSADPTVTIGGVSFIAQYLTGSLDNVAVSAPRVTVQGQDGSSQGVSFAAHIDAHQVPTNGEAVGSASGTLTIDQENVQRIAVMAGISGGSGSGSSGAGSPDLGTITLGDGTLSYGGTLSFLGLDIGYTATAKPIAKGDIIELEPTALKLSAGSASVDLDRLLGELAKKPIPICVAQYLPERVQVSDIRIENKQAVVTLDATHLALNEKSLSTHGACPLS